MNKVEEQTMTLRQWSKGNIAGNCQKEHPEFCDEVAGLSVEQLDSRLAQLAKAAEAVEDSKDADSDLAQAQEAASQLAAPYRDSKKALRIKSRYIIALIKDKGGK